MQSFRCYAIALAFLTFSFVPGHAEDSTQGLNVLSSSKSSSSHRVIVGNVKEGKWVVCWGLGGDGTPLAKGMALVKGKFVEVMIRAGEHHNSVVNYYCEYEE